MEKGFLNHDGHYFFCGIGGSGMSPIALFLQKSGYKVSGSDRNLASLAVQRLKAAGITVYPQDGSGVNAGINVMIASTAIEDTVPDMQRAKELNLPVIRRANILADILHSFKNSIAVGGTSGKSTVSSMLTYILTESGLAPSAVIGAKMTNFGSDFIKQSSDFMIIEADESDGSIELYSPLISVVTNISLDHKPLAELRPLFKAFVQRAKLGAVVNADDLESLCLLPMHKNIVTFSCENRKSTLAVNDIIQDGNGCSFTINRIPFRLNLIGRHNIANAAAAVASAFLCGVSLQASSAALTKFQGVARRLETVGQTKDNITVIDDFAHNPAKIIASLQAVKTAVNLTGGRIFAVYQPHGFAPTRLMKDDLIACFKACLGQEDFLQVLPIFYAGGTVAKDISAADLVLPLKQVGLNASAPNDRKKALTDIISCIKANDFVIVMGARDDTLSLFAQDIFAAVNSRLGKEP